MAKHLSGSQTYRLTDGLGSTTELLDGAGNVLVSYRYDAFGGIRSQSIAHDNYWLFAGEQRDAETGYDYLRARYYDSDTGRFISVDPLGDGYPYVSNNPLRFTDPLGLYQICGDHEIWGWICFDSTEVGLGACDIWGNCYIWTPDRTYELSAVFGNVCVFEYAYAGFHECYSDRMTHERDLAYASAYAGFIVSQYGSVCRRGCFWCRSPMRRWPLGLQCDMRLS